MRGAADDDPMGPQYWADFEIQLGYVETDRVKRVQRYGDPCAPAARVAEPDPPAAAVPE